jgi:UDP-N-acetylmuramate--alanine ligase
LKGLGIRLFPQDSSGITGPAQVLRPGGGGETVPDVVAAPALNAPGSPQLLARLFNQADLSVGIAGTSGKSTTTGMLGWILERCGGAHGDEQRGDEEFRPPDAPFPAPWWAMARPSSPRWTKATAPSPSTPPCGGGEQHRPDHKSMDELAAVRRLHP